MSGRVTVSRVASVVRGLRDRTGSRYKEIRNAVAARIGREPGFFELKGALAKSCSLGIIRRDKTTGRFLSGTYAGVNAKLARKHKGVGGQDGEGKGYHRRRRSKRRGGRRDILANYHLPMDEIDDRALVNPSGLDSVVEGGAQLTQGVRDKALLIDGRTQWLRVTGAGHRRECMGDLARCEKGYYLGMWMQFRGAGYQRGVYLSNGGHSSNGHGVAFLYTKGKLEVIFKMADGREWRTRSHDVLENRWYHVAATWSQEKGLHLYINGEKAGHDRTAAKRSPANENSRYNGFYIGRANDNTGTDRLGQVLVDDFMFQSAFKTEKEMREGGPIYRYHLSMDGVKNDRLEGKGLEGRVYGAASVVEGKVGGAVLLSGGREYLDLGDVSDTCLSDLELCQYGLYMSFWAKFNSLDTGRKALVSSPSLGVFQDGTLLVASVKLTAL
nr:hypothetical protein BaRGS_006749 [Batillaria attramentaria]